MVTMIMPSDYQIVEDRRQDLLATLPRGHRITAATPSSPNASSRAIGRIRSGLSHAIASIVALTAIG